ncbi:hypothetical protein SARC_03355 [Sphaeroforma arctica JP610]|uniref:beta-N-acetylhexosaminidase n=1 Tax=Sphaeroforma arctica JP610 TaxID=667725 RepID=A0A0L0G5X2_9EUKA|nr:hypothetical protein SARC_03355 [Sphaeroforma arctica JP610]KNC84427.1 hypothetical protein SARC_03355 [Sphaeroforma arctica JP610]|eukprot:XP_014158329.1 hypothetical protein SARC_03355 [Sphaeroforma arctica JP610]
MKEIVEYARQFEIKVVSEFDIPDHASAIAMAYPKLIAELCDDYIIERKWGVFEPFLYPALPEVYNFITKIMKEATSIFTDEYIHIGGDEINPKQWTEGATIQAFMIEENLADDLVLLASFNARPQAALMHYRNEELPHALRVDDAVTSGETWETWQFMAPRKRGSEVHGDFTLLPVNLRYQTWHILFTFLIVLTANEEKLIKGGEVTLWGKIIKEDTIDVRMWPRSYVISEQLWSSINLIDEDSKLPEAVEQAQYYHRHHEKSANENYDQFDPLNRFADSLPPEIKTAMIQTLNNSWTDKYEAVSFLNTNNYLLTDNNYLLTANNYLLTANNY